MTEASAPEDEAHMARALELAGPRALRQVAGDCHDVVAILVNQRFHRLILLRHGGRAEVKVGAVEDGNSFHSRAMMASVN